MVYLCTKFNVAQCHMASLLQYSYGTKLYYIHAIYIYISPCIRLYIKLIFHPDKITTKYFNIIFKSLHDRQTSTAIERALASVCACMIRAYRQCLCLHCTSVQTVSVPALLHKYRETVSLAEILQSINLLNKYIRIMYTAIYCILPMDNW